MRWAKAAVADAPSSPSTDPLLRLTFRQLALPHGDHARPLSRRSTMGKTIVITGAGSGFGALSARALAHSGHTVYAAMRGTTGRNADRVAEAAAYAAEHGVDLRTVELDVL